MKGWSRSCWWAAAAPTKLAMGKRRDSSWGLGVSGGGAGFGSGLQEVRRRARAMRSGARIVGSIPRRGGRKTSTNFLRPINNRPQVTNLPHKKQLSNVQKLQGITQRSGERALGVRES